MMVVALDWRMAFEAEHYWRERGEQAIRDEMERKLAVYFANPHRHQRVFGMRGASAKWHPAITPAAAV